MYGLMKDGAPIATSAEPITYDPTHGGWLCGGLMYLDPDNVMRPLAPVTPPEFKLLFTAVERVAITARRKVDPLLDERFSVLDDPRLTEVVLFLPEVVDGVTSLTTAFTPDGGTKIPAILTSDRPADILNGLRPGTTAAAAAAAKADAAAAKAAAKAS